LLFFTTVMMEDGAQERGGKREIRERASRDGWNQGMMRKVAEWWDKM